MKILKRIVITGILIIIFVGIYLIINHYNNQDIYSNYKNCCLEKYNGILWWNDCVSLSEDDKCVNSNTQRGWNCIYTENTTKIKKPYKTMNCS